jgi:hypothetical protein
MHLLIPFAAPPQSAASQALAQLQLPNLQALLSRLQLNAPQDCGIDSYDAPHERVHASLLHLEGADGQLPWAAWQTRPADGGIGQDDTPCAWLTLCHWQTHSQGFVMTDPEELAVTAEESQQLLALMQPYFLQDRLSLEPWAPGQWLVRGPWLSQMRCASLNRVINCQIRPWMAQGPQALQLHRLQSEMQMLLYTHHINDARSARGQRTINSFWLTGAGVGPVHGPARAPAMDLVIADGLRKPALHGQWPVWRQVWQELDQGIVRQALLAHGSGQAVSLTLCGERLARTYETRPRSWLQRLAQHWTTASLPQHLDGL